MSTEPAYDHAAVIGKHRQHLNDMVSQAIAMRDLMALQALEAMCLACEAMLARANNNLPVAGENLMRAIAAAEAAAKNQ